MAGPDALQALQWICAADVDVPVGRCVYTPFLNGRGTYEADLTVTRSGPEEFVLVSSSATTVRDLDWLRRHSAGLDVTITDTTDATSVIGVMGPSSRTLLSRLGGADAWEAAFASSTVVRLAGVEVRATRMTYVGELGWELMVAVADATALYDAVKAAGADLGVVDAGYHAIEALRLEKGYRAFGRELTPDLTPVEAGLVFATALATGGDFLGRDALSAHRAALALGGPRRRLVSFVSASPEPMLWGGELLLRDGRPCGQVTSAAWGATVGAAVGLAYLRSETVVTSDDLARGGFQVDLAGELVDVRLSLRAPLA
ncbi:unannotated protein [freshwater metagenome]|uniref:Unannotated protein n=1 Tax=freshwater metagenome TaxID=449393 RepID=A0A6J6Q1J5_9ZZZZ